MNRKPVNWPDVDLSTPEKLHEFALSVEEGGRRAVADAISHHRAIGNPIYFREQANSDVLIKELSDGRRFHVVIAEDGSETVVEPLS